MNFFAPCRPLPPLLASPLYALVTHFTHGATLRPTRHCLSCYSTPHSLCPFVGAQRFRRKFTTATRIPCAQRLVLRPSPSWLSIATRGRVLHCFPGLRLLLSSSLPFSVEQVKGAAAPQPCPQVATAKIQPRPSKGSGFSHFLTGGMLFNVKLRSSFSPLRSPVASISCGLPQKHARWCRRQVGDCVALYQRTQPFP